MRFYVASALLSRAKALNSNDTTRFYVASAPHVALRAPFCHAERFLLFTHMKVKI